MRAGVCVPGRECVGERLCVCRDTRLSFPKELCGRTRVYTPESPKRLSTVSTPGVSTEYPPSTSEYPLEYSYPPNIPLCDC